MIAQYVINVVWRRVRAIVCARATGWIAACIVLLATLLTRWQPAWEQEIAAVRDVVTNAVWANETAITGVVGQLPADLQ